MNKKLKPYQLNPTKFLSDEEVAIMFRVLDRRSVHALFVEFMFSTGCRKQEALNITRGDLRDHSVHIRTIKNGPDRTLPIMAPLWNALMKFFGDFTPDERLFKFEKSQAHDIWVKYRPRKSAKLHSLRHTFLKNLYESSRNLLLCKYAAGHSSINSTCIYSVYVDGTEGLKQHISKALKVV